MLCDGDDSWFNGAFTRLPGGARFEIEMQWGSIGWGVPATFGYAMGLEPDRRLVSVTAFVVGDIGGGNEIEGQIRPGYTARVKALTDELRYQGGYSLSARD